MELFTKGDIEYVGGGMSIMGNSSQKLNGLIMKDGRTYILTNGDIIESIRESKAECKDANKP